MNGTNYHLLLHIVHKFILKIAQKLINYRLPGWSESNKLLCDSIYCIVPGLNKLLAAHRAKLRNNNELNHINTSLHSAASRGLLNIVETLLNLGADVNEKNEQRQTPLHLAVKRGHETTVRLLLDWGAEPNLADISGQCPLHDIFDGGNLESLNIAKLLIDYGAEVNIQNDKGETALHIACYRGKLQIVAMLLEKGSDINVTAKGGNPLDFVLTGNQFSPSRIYRLIFDYILIHSIKLLYAGLHLDDEFHCIVQDELGDQDWVVLKSNSSHTRRLCSQVRKCYKELVELKRSRFDANVSLYHILTTKNIGYIMNQTLARDLETFNYEQYPIYGNLIESKFKKDRNRFELLKTGTESFGMLTGLVEGVALPILPYEVVMKILGHLENIDLRSLICCLKSLNSLHKSTPM